MMNRYNIDIDGEQHQVTLISKRGDTLSFEHNGVRHQVTVRPDFTGQSLKRGSIPTPIQPTQSLQKNNNTTPGEICAPMPGVVVQVSVAKGDSVSQGDTLLSLEAMKMENNIAAMSSGTVTKVHVKAGQEVEKGQLLVTVE